MTAAPCPADGERESTERENREPAGVDIGDEAQPDGRADDPGVPTPTEAATDYDYQIDLRALFTALASVSVEETV